MKKKKISQKPVTYLEYFARSQNLSLEEAKRKLKKIRAGYYWIKIKNWDEIK